MLLVVILLRRGRTVEWVAAAAVAAFLFWGLFYSYSQSSFVALFVVTFAVALSGSGRRLRIVLVACALVATLAAAAVAADAVERTVGAGRDERPLAARRRDARRLRGPADRRRRGRRPAARERGGVGQGLAEPERVAHDAADGARRARRARLRALRWVLGGGRVGASILVASSDRVFGVGLAAVLLVLVVHSLLYAGFFEDPLTWGVFAPRRSPRGIAGVDAEAFRGCWHTDQRRQRPGLLLMPRAFKWIIARRCPSSSWRWAASSIAIGLTHDPPSGRARHGPRRRHRLDVHDARPLPNPPPPKPEPTADRRCWRTFGGRPAALARPPGRAARAPERKPLWTRGLGSYIEFPPTYCDGDLYVNTFEGATYAIDAETGKVQWRRRVGGTLPSSPAIDGPRVIVSSQDGTVTALDRRKGRVLWQVQTAGKVESSPVAVDGLVYFGSHDGRLFAVRADDGERALGVPRPAVGSTRARRFSAGGSASRRTPAPSSAWTRKTGQRALDDVRQA